MRRRSPAVPAERSACVLLGHRLRTRRHSAARLLGPRSVGRSVCARPDPRREPVRRPLHRKLLAIEVGVDARSARVARRPPVDHHVRPSKGRRRGSGPTPIDLDAAPTPNATVTPVPTATPVPTDTPAPAATPEATVSPVPSATPVPTDTPAPAATPEATVSPVPSATPVPTATPEATASPSPTEEPTPEPPATTGTATIDIVATIDPHGAGPKAAVPAARWLVYWQVVVGDEQDIVEEGDVRTASDGRATVSVGTGPGMSVDLWEDVPSAYVGLGTRCVDAGSGATVGESPFEYVGFTPAAAGITRARSRTPRRHPGSSCRRHSSGPVGGTRIAGSTASPA